ncbi:hypothetical protein HPP92_003639 [Vanilla planifolia]|uniref:Uncharacterized protein n=1 Tax=Vanilla planifolia TaxID=51239 RepID=A0A835S7V9_VANPL|nr:hypothetical protein HPP92_003639 [Vanilla planifolia]
MGSSLPPKEANLFKVIVKSYETKQYKKGLKAADAILKKFPEHGETLSMKGLTLNCVDRKSEAYELVRRGLKNDLKSHVCWHVYGLLYRSDREYREAIKCYRNALKIDPDNIEILRDLSLLQAQMRDLDGFVETRQQLLTLKPNHRTNWIGFAVAHHLNSNSSKAVDILDAYEGTLEDDYPSENERCEHGEMLLYKVSLLEESGLLDRALEEMYKKEAKIVDKLSFKEQLVSILVKLGRKEEGEKLYKSLLQMNPDNYRYFVGLQKCLNLYCEDGLYTSEQVSQLDILYALLKEQYSWSYAAKRIPLDFLHGEKFQQAAENYVRPLLTKGVPSLFSDLSPLYDHHGKADILEQVFIELESSIRASGCFPGSEQKEPPSTLMWSLFLLAQHYERRGQYDIALIKIDEAIKHTPTVIDLYSIKGRILKHAGDLAAAAALADEARTMDLADRYLNSECVLRMLEADQMKKQELQYVDVKPVWMSSLWSILCLYKGSCHAPLMVVKAINPLCRCYMKLHDSPLKAAGGEDGDMSGLLPAQKRKLKQKQKKAEARAKKEAEEKGEEANSLGMSKTARRQQAKPVDLDPHGEKLLQVEDPLSEATKYLKLLQNNSSQSLETHILSFELNMRKQKILLAFQAVKQLLKLDENSPDSHRCLIKFFHRISSSASETETEKLISSVLEAERLNISQLHGNSLVEVNRDFLLRHKDSLMHRAAAAEMLYVLEPDKKHEALQLILETENNIAPVNGSLGPVRQWKIEECISVHKLLEEVFVSPESANSWKTHCAQYFPYSTYFEGLKSSLVTGLASYSMPENGDLSHQVGDGRTPNGNLHAFKDLSI